MGPSRRPPRAGGRRVRVDAGPPITPRALSHCRAVRDALQRPNRFGERRFEDAYLRLSRSASGEGFYGAGAGGDRDTATRTRVYRGSVEPPLRTGRRDPVRGAGVVGRRSDRRRAPGFMPPPRARPPVRLGALARCEGRAPSRVYHIPRPGPSEPRPAPAVRPGSVGGSRPVVGRGSRRSGAGRGTVDRTSRRGPGRARARGEAPARLPYVGYVGVPRTRPARASRRARRPRGDRTGPRSEHRPVLAFGRHRGVGRSTDRTIAMGSRAASTARSTHPTRSPIFRAGRLGDAATRGPLGRGSTRLVSVRGRTRFKVSCRIEPGCSVGLLLRIRPPAGRRGHRVGSRARARIPDRSNPLKQHRTEGLD